METSESRRTAEAVAPGRPGAVGASSPGLSATPRQGCRRDPDGDAPSCGEPGWGVPESRGGSGRGQCVGPTPLGLGPLSSQGGTERSWDQTCVRGCECGVEWGHVPAPGPAGLAPEARGEAGARWLWTPRAISWRRTDSAAWPRQCIPPHGRDGNALERAKVPRVPTGGRGAAPGGAGLGEGPVPHRPEGLRAVCRARQAPDGLWLPTLLPGSKTRDMESGRSSLSHYEVPDGDQLEARGSEPAASEAPGTPESSRLFKRCGDPPWGGPTLTLGTRPSWDLALGQVVRIS